MAAGDVKLQYAASVNLTVTTLNSIASSTTHLGGWEGDAIDNSSNEYTDYRITAKITVGPSGLAAGEIRLHVVTELDDSTWPDVFDGTGGAETVTDSEIRDAICHLVAISVTDTTANRVYYLSCPSLRRALGNVPRKWVPFITQSSGANLASSGNQVTVQGMYEQVAQS